MPTPSSSYQRHSRPNSPPVEYTTPLRSRLSGVLATPGAGGASSSTPTTAYSAQNQKTNVVTRVAIEGKAVDGEDGVGIKMYLKISLPLDSVTPGSSIPLFAEENVKILDSQVHPLDPDSVPYEFSAELSPLLHHAQRALSLHGPQQDYHSAFGLSPPAGVASSRINGSGRRQPVAPLDDKYTGQILVSLYNIAYVLPKVFPVRLDSGRTSSLRRSSIAAERMAHFMAAIDLWVPYLGRPPRSPFLLSIPTPPRCLSNTIRLRLFAPPSVSSSVASLESRSTDDGNYSWDLRSDPSVTRKPSAGRHARLPRGEDDSSDSDVVDAAGGMQLQGAFRPSDRIRIRWAKPQVTIGPPDGLRRAGVDDVKGEMSVFVLGKRWDVERKREGIAILVDYKASCKGLFSPSVATMLGLDVSLEAQGSDLAWLPDPETNKWDVGGGTGYTGFEVVGSPTRSKAPSRHDSIDSTYSNGFISGERPISRASSASSSASLLRGPLPTMNVPEYSFEGAPSESQSTSLDSSLVASSLASSEVMPRPPGVPITVHLDIDKLTTLVGKNSFTFSIKGTVLVLPRSRGEENTSLDGQADPETVVVPQFGVITAQKEEVTVLVRNDMDAGSATLEVMNASGPESRSKKVLQRGDYVKCQERARIAVRSGVAFVSTPTMGPNGKPLPPSRPRTPTSRERERLGSGTGTKALAVLGMGPARPKRDGTLMIPTVRAEVTPLCNDGRSVPNSYAVRVFLAAPAEADSDWLEFGLAKQDDGVVPAPPKVDIVGVSVDDVPVLYETRVKGETSQAQVGLPFEKMGGTGQEWVSWVRMRVGAAGGGRIVVDYVVKDVDGAPLDAKGKGKMKARERTRFDLYLPTFSLPVGRLEVNIDAVPGFELSNLRSNFSHQQEIPSGRKLFHYSLPALFYPHISLDLSRDRRYSNVAMFASMLLASTVVLLFAMLYIGRANTLAPNAIEYVYATLDPPPPLSGVAYDPDSASTNSAAFQWPWYRDDAPPHSTPPETEPETDIYPSVTMEDSQPADAASSLRSPITTVTTTSAPGSFAVALRYADHWRWGWDWPVMPESVNRLAERAKHVAGVLWGWFLLAYV
ncbi:hypothetical protein MKEN_01062700 [Mycena kentingensis (nom. inval.)]|nr:hypothetical protein MKEN_01062700 [Mycena kentingensis (nom. inval.)]